MKTTKQIQKTANPTFRTKTITLAFALTLLCTYGQSHEKSNLSLSESPIAFAMNSNSGKRIKTDIPKMPQLNFKAESKETVQGFSFETESEDSLKIETWMISNKYLSPARTEIQVEKDKPLEIENWMTDKQFWGL